MATRSLARWIAPLVNRVGGMVLRATVSAVNAATKIQQVAVQAYADDDDDEVDYVEPYGLTSHPLPPDSAGSAEAVLVMAGANADHAIAIVVADKRYRLAGLAAGEVALYDDTGQRVHLTRTGIVVKAGSIKLGETALVATDGVVHGTGIDPFTGATYAALGNVSTVVLAKK